MNRSDLVEHLAIKKGLPIKVADKVVETIFDSMTESLYSGNRIEIRGFGSFEVKQYDGYTGRNPKSGKLVAVKPKKSPFFRVGKKLKERVMNSGCQ